MIVPGKLYNDQYKFGCVKYLIYDIFTDTTKVEKLY